MAESDDLVARLREEAASFKRHYPQYTPIQEEAADEIEALRAEVAMLHIELKTQYMLGYKTGLDDGFNQ